MEPAPSIRVALPAQPQAGSPRKVSGAGWALADQCIVSASNFVTIYLFARCLQPSVFGELVLGYTALLLLTGLQGALVTQPHNVLAAALAPRAYRRFTGAMAIAQLGLCIGLSAALGLASAASRALSLPAAAGVLSGLAFAATPWFGQEFVRRVLYTRGESRSVALNDLLTYGLQLAGTVTLLVRWPEDATPRAGLLVLGLSSAAGVALGLWQLREHAQLRGIGWRRCVGVWREAWEFGKWLTAQNALSWFGSQGHVWLVGIVLGPGPVGLYRAATHFAHLLNPVRQAAFSYLPSRGSVAYDAGGAPALSRWVRRTAILLLIVLLPPAVLLIAFSGDVLRLAYGAQYSGPRMALILAAATAAQCITFWKFPFDIGLLALRATKQIFLVNLVPVPLLLMVGTALVYFLGIVGAPLSALVISAALLVATRAAFRRRLAGGDMARAAEAAP